MSFQEELETICQEVPGTRAVWVTNVVDSIPVAQYQPKNVEDLDIEVLLTELSTCLNAVKDALMSANAGDLAVCEISTAKGTLLVRMLKEEYFIVLFMDPKALVGRGRYMIRRHALPLLENLD